MCKADSRWWHAAVTVASPPRHPISAKGTPDEVERAKTDQVLARLSRSVDHGWDLDDRAVTAPTYEELTALVALQTRIVERDRKPRSRGGSWPPARATPP